MLQYQAILFDLDGTLLRNDMKKFMKHYFEMLVPKFRNHLSPDAFMQAMNAGIEAMVVNEGPQTNEEIFKQAFFTPIQVKPEEIMPLFDDFYQTDFRKLQQVGEFKPEVPEMMKVLFDSGCRVVIATNPLFPESAIMQRLAWAGLSDYEFEWVTTYENSCATKASEKYYQDILDILKLTSEDCLMVGDQAWDLIAANIGLDTFFVPSPNSDLTDQTPQPKYRGSISDLFKLMTNK
jgi:HAD superfamily hydrolase (TIGR01549 family)